MTWGSRVSDEEATRPIPGRLRLVLVAERADGELHALAERSSGPALCTLPEPPAPGWRMHGFTVQLDCIGCGACRTFAEALAGMARANAT